MRADLVWRRFSCWRGGRLRFAVTVAALLIAAAPALCLAQEGGKPLTLDEAMKIALANNKSVAIAQSLVSKARGAVRQASSADNPQIGIQTNYTKIGPKPPGIRFLVADDPNDPHPTAFHYENIQFSTTEQKSATATLTKVLDVFGQVRLGVSIAQLQEAIQELDVLRTTQQLTLDVKQTYYNVLRAEAQREVADKSVQAAEEHLRIAQVQFKAGVSARFDVIRAEVDVANNKQNLISTTNAVMIATSVLNNTLGIDVNAPTKVQNVALTVRSAVPEGDIGRNTEIAYKSRPEVLQSQVTVKLNQQAVNLNKRGLWPTLVGSATSGWSGSGGLASPTEFPWTAGLMLNIPIWDGGATKAKVEQSKSDLDIAGFQLEQLKLGVALEVRSQLLNLNEAAERVSTAAENVKQAEEALRLAQVRYQSGISTAVEVTDAEVSLRLTRMIEVNANFDYLVALARLERAVGAEPKLGGASGQASGGPLPNPPPKGEGVKNPPSS